MMKKVDSQKYLPYRLTPKQRQKMGVSEGIDLLMPRNPDQDNPCLVNAHNEILKELSMAEAFRM